MHLLHPLIQWCRSAHRFQFQATSLSHQFLSRVPVPVARGSRHLGSVIHCPTSVVGRDEGRREGAVVANNTLRLDPTNAANHVHFVLPCASFRTYTGRTCRLVPRGWCRQRYTCAGTRNPSTPWLRSTPSIPSILWNSEKLPSVSPMDPPKETGVLCVLFRQHRICRNKKGTK